MLSPVGLSSRDSVGSRTDSQCSLEQQRQFLLNEHTPSAFYATATTVEGRFPTTCHSADSDTDILTFNTNSYNIQPTTKTTTTTTATSSNINSANNYSYSNFENFNSNNSTTTTTAKDKTFTVNCNKTSSNNYTTTSSNLFGSRNMCHSSFDNQAQPSVSPADLLLNTLLATGDCTLEYQTPSVAQPPRHASTSRSLPDLQFVADLFGAPMLSDLNSTEDFVEYQASASAPVSPTHQQQFSGPDSALAYSAMYSEPPAMPYFDVQGSAYDSFLNTPANFEYFASPNVNIAGSSQGVLSDGHKLFAPLDEFAAKDPMATSSWSSNDLLGDLVNTYPGLHLDLVHALVNSISPTMAYQPVGASASSSIVPTLVTQAQSLAEVQFNNTEAGDALLVDTLLGLLSPTADVAETPMLYDAMTASPAMLELFSSLSSPATTSMAAAPVFTVPHLPDSVASDEDDMPLLKRKRCSDEDVSDSGSLRQQTSEEPAKKRMFYCDICNHGFSRQYNLDKHKLTHDPKSKAARPFACMHCSRTFTRKHDLTRHQVLHDASDAIKCTLCSRAFARQDVLERHMLAIHKDKA
ncbi:hypothetical protein H4R27_004131 [Coemansia aciculifera]|nr:hypothetical protein H4R27_004131 [Coemansia aciculifera]